MEGDGQRHALSMAKSYAQNFGTGFASFVFTESLVPEKPSFSGDRQLPAEAGENGSDCDCADLTLRARACYDEGQSEAALLDDLCKVDLLVLDEVGIQRDSRGEKVLLNQIIDRRLAAMRPVGVLTNLNYDALVETLGERLLTACAWITAFWVNFDWESYRGNVSHLRPVK